MLKVFTLRLLRRGSLQSESFNLWKAAPHSFVQWTLFGWFLCVSSLRGADMIKKLGIKWLYQLTKPMKDLSWAFVTGLSADLMALTVPSWGQILPVFTEHHNIIKISSWKRFSTCQYLVPHALKSSSCSMKPKEENCKLEVSKGWKAVISLLWGLKGEG